MGLHSVRKRRADPPALRPLCEAAGLLGVSGRFAICYNRGNLLGNLMTTFRKTVLFTGTDGRACFREDALSLTEGTPAARLSPLAPSGGYQLRESRVGFRSDFHCTGAPQWLFVLQGQMEIGLQDGSKRLFGPGEHFFSADTLPDGATFDPTLHGHCSRQVGDEPLVTLFVRAAA